MSIVSSGGRLDGRRTAGPVRCRRRTFVIGSALLAVGVAPSAFAQWIHYPTPGIPRTAEGKPDLTAPAPRAADGKPDLSGIWYGTPLFDFPIVFEPPLLGDMLKAAGFTELPPNPCLPGACIEQEAYPADGANIGRSLPGRELPYLPSARQLVMERAAKQGAEDPHARCAPPTYPRAFALPQHWKIVQTPKLIVLLHEFNASYRQIFLDGRPLPVDPLPAWNGYSVGRWEGDTLVVETTGFRDEDLWLDNIGSPLSGAALITERFRRVDFGTLQIEVTVDDPRSYTKPWTVPIEQRLVADTELLDDICVENERSLRLLEEERP